MDGNAETEKLKAIAQKTRLRTITTELTLALTWCSVARTEFEMGEVDRFQRSLGRIKRAAESLRRRIADPAHVSREVSPGFDPLLKTLQVKIEELEARLQNGRQTTAES